MLEPAPRIAVIEPTDLDLGEKEDVADLIAQLEAVRNNKAQIQATILEALNTAKPRGIAAGVGQMIEDTIAGRREAAKWRWSRVGGLTKALMPGTVTVLCGNVGASKSFMLLEAAAYWHERDLKAAVFELEEDKRVMQLQLEKLRQEVETDLGRPMTTDEEIEIKGSSG